jgi:hypothetical protein
MNPVLDRYDLSTVCESEDYKSLKPILKRIPEQLNALHYAAADKDMERSRSILEKLWHSAEDADDETMMNEVCLVSIYV